MKRIGVYANKQVDAAMNLLEQYRSGEDEEALHQLRVSLKKLKAVLDYLQAVFPKKTKALRKKLQVVFHAAGSLRELQLHINWLQKKRYNALIDAAQLFQKLKEEEALFTSYKAGWKKLLMKLAIKLEKIISGHRLHIVHYVSSLKEDVETFSANEATEKWHKRRKQLKQLLYAQHWLKKAERLKLLPGQLYKQYDQLQEAVGSWHDAMDREIKLQQELFYLHADKKVKQQYGRCLFQVKKEQQHYEKTIKRLLTAGSKANTVYHLK